MFWKALFTGAFAMLAAAQSAVLTFTHVPNPVTDGQPQALTFATNDTMTPVTILLRQGPSNNLVTVSTLTTGATGGQFVWVPHTDLPNGVDYALEIMQGNEVNYFGPFVVQGAGPGSYASSSSATPTSMDTMMSSTTSMAASSTSSMPTNGTTSSTPTDMPGTTVGTMGMAIVTANTTFSVATLPMPTTDMASSSTTMTEGSMTSSMGMSSATATVASSTGAAAAGLKVGGLLALVCGGFAVAF